MSEYFENILKDLRIKNPQRGNKPISLCAPGIESASEDDQEGYRLFLMMNKLLANL